MKKELIEKITKRLEELDDSNFDEVSESIDKISNHNSQKSTLKDVIKQYFPADFKLQSQDAKILNISDSGDAETLFSEDGIEAAVVIIDTNKFQDKTSVPTVITFLSGYSNEDIGWEESITYDYQVPAVYINKQKIELPKNKILSDFLQEHPIKPGDVIAFELIPTEFDWEAIEVMIETDEYKK